MTKPSEEDGSSPRLLPKIDQKRVFASLFETPEPQPEVLGRFQIKQRLGRGAMGTVMEGYDPSLDRAVAIKVLHEAAGTRHQKRLLREAQALAQLSHPNVVQVFETGEIDGRLFIAMELVRGETLWSWHEQPHPWRTCLEVYLQAGRGLAAAHAVGIVHRDFKPANCIIDEQGRLRVLDFGLARGLSDLDDEEQEKAARSLRSMAATLQSNAGTASGQGSASSRPLDQRLTQTGTMLGTPAYMAPEQARGKPADARADQFSFCVGLYEALYGRRPFHGIAGLFDPEHDPPPSYEPEPTHASQPSAPAWLRRILMRGLAPSRDDRFADMTALVDAIEGHLRASRNRKIGLALGLGVLATVGTTRAFTPNEAAAPRCEIDATALADTWGPEQREAVRKTFTGSTLSFAETTHQAIDAGLERWAGDWVETRTDACVATQIEGTASETLLDRRVDCLDRQQREATALVEVLSTADTATIVHAPQLLAELPDPARCDDPPTARGAALPSDAAARDEVLDGYQRLAKGRARMLSGALTEADAAMESVATLGRERGFSPLEIEAQVFRGELAWSRGNYDEAAKALSSAAHRAVAEGLPSLELSARRRGVDALVGRWSKPDAETMMLDALAAAATRDDAQSVSLQHSILAARARLALVAGNHERALELSRELRKAQPEGSGLPNVNAWLDEAAALALLTRHEEAEALLGEGLTVAVRGWGEGSPGAARIEQELGMLALETGKLDQAEQRLATARRHLEAATGPESVPVARVRFSQAKLAMSSGGFEQAGVDLEHVGRVFARDLGATHEETGHLFNALGVARFYEGDYPGSIEAYERALVAGLASYGPTHSEVGLLHSNIAESHAALGKHEEALDQYAKALAIMRASLADDHPFLATPYKGRGQSLLTLGRRTEAVASLERALALLLKPPSEPFELADTRLALARALRESKQDPARVDELSRLAAEGFDQLGFEDRAARARALMSSPTSAN
ncbi:MAG: serine/threonine-protein kinase [Myxococcota bacterium]